LTPKNGNANEKKNFYYRVSHLKTPIKNAYCWAQGVPKEEGMVLPCPFIAPIFFVKISAF
jgi:hypothetical protein